MNPADIYHKTEKGVDEIAHRTHKLPQKLRTMLIMVDGIKPAALLAENARRLGVEGDFLADLEQSGFITRRPAGEAVPIDEQAPVVRSEDEVTRFLEVQQFMNDIILDKLGSMRGYGLMLKLQKAEDLAGLRVLLDEFQTALAKKYPLDEAQDLTEQVRDRLK